MKVCLVQSVVTWFNLGFVAHLSRILQLCNSVNDELTCRMGR